MAKIAEALFAYILETQTMISGHLGYVGKESFQEIREDIGDVQRMLKAMIKSLENK